MSTYGELAREMEAEDLLEAPPSWPWPFSAGGSLLLEAAAEEMLLRPGSLCSADPVPPSILPPRDAHGGKARGLGLATALIHRRGGGGGVRCLLPHQMARTIRFRKTGMDLIRTSES